MKNTALLVVDVQTGLIMEKPFAMEEVIRNIKSLIEKSRENHVEVIYIQHNGKIGDELEPHSKGWEIYEELKPNDNETIIGKNYNSAFKGTRLKEYLDSKGITQLIITGMQTDYCIDATCKVAFEYGFEVFIPEKTNTTFNNGNISAKDLYEHYNFSIWNHRFAKVEKIPDVIQRLIEDK